MARRPTTRALWAVLVLLALLPACARQPTTTVATAPPPTAAVTVPPAVAPPPAEAAPLPPPPAAPVMPPRPPVDERYVPVPELQDVHFDFDRYDIRPGDAQILDEHARWMRAHRAFLIVIEGHADERGTNEYNLALGERRATAVLQYLAARGVATTRMRIVSYGEERPLCTERTEGCWARNRRAHFRARAE
jgi:peptidoglycan-associated lipoprotein